MGSLAGYSCARSMLRLNRRTATTWWRVRSRRNGRKFAPSVNGCSMSGAYRYAHGAITRVTHEVKSGAAWWRAKARPRHVFGSSLARSMRKSTGDLRWRGVRALFQACWRPGWVNNFDTLRLFSSIVVQFFVMYIRFTLTPGAGVRTNQLIATGCGHAHQKPVVRRGHCQALWLICRARRCIDQRARGRI